MEKEPGSIHSSFWSNLFKQAPKSNELLEMMKEIPPFVSLPKKSLKALLQIVHHRNFISGENIFYQGDPGLGLYIILEGEVSIQYFSPKGKKVTLANFTTGDFFGELALLDGEKRSASALASTDCKIAIIFKPDLDEYIIKNPKEGISILHGISKIIITRLRHLNNEFLLLHDSATINKENRHELTN
jgi:CRP/FNR family transcriptional regulator, cyclic AMP receptor protein